jgi:prepilin-type processing-associated H-X9-DG protein
MNGSYQGCSPKTYHNITSEWLSNGPQASSLDFFKYTQIRQAQDHVFMYDGYYIMPENGSAAGNPVRIRGRHDRYTTTNLLFLDGHVENMPRTSLVNLDTDFTNGLLNISNIAKARPYWRCDQP